MLPLQLRYAADPASISTSVAKLARSASPLEPASQLTKTCTFLKFACEGPTLVLSREGNEKGGGAEKMETKDGDKESWRQRDGELERWRDRNRDRDIKRTERGVERGRQREIGRSDMEKAEEVRPSVTQ